MRKAGGRRRRHKVRWDEPDFRFCFRLSDPVVTLHRWNGNNSEATGGESSLGIVTNTKVLLGWDIENWRWTPTALSLSPPPHPHTEGEGGQVTVSFQPCFSLRVEWSGVVREWEGRTGLSCAWDFGSGLITDLPPLSHWAFWMHVDQSSWNSKRTWIHRPNN